MRYQSISLLSLPEKVLKLQTSGRLFSLIPTTLVPSLIELNYLVFPFSFQSSNDFLTSSFTSPTKL